MKRHLLSAAAGVATKMRFSKKPLAENAEFIRTLKISKEDIRRLKYDNMFSVV